jgi:hypothetical protein
MSKISLIPGTVAINENGELGIIQSKAGANYTGINLSRQEMITRPGFDKKAFTYLGGAEWTSTNPEVICHTDDLQLLGEKMYSGEEVPVEKPAAGELEGYICFCSNPILGVATSNEKGLTDMGEDRWPGYHLTTGEVLKKSFKGRDINYAFESGGPWSSSKPRAIVKVEDLVQLGSTIRAWAHNELAIA